jgi:hypothetical protein
MTVDLQNAFPGHAGRNQIKKKIRDSYVPDFFMNGSLQPHFPAAVMVCKRGDFHLIFLFPWNTFRIS